MDWQPDQENLDKVLHLLRNAILLNNRDQGQVQQRISLFNAMPEYNSYLIYILVMMNKEDGYTRTIAGLTLKNNILNNLNRIKPMEMDCIKNISFRALDMPDINSTIRKTIGSVIIAIVMRAHESSVPEVLIVLMNKLDDNNTLTVEMALDSLQKICQDHANRLIDQPILNLLIPKLISFHTSTTIQFRVHALSAVSQFIPLKSHSLLRNMDIFIPSLFTIHTDAEVQQEICRSFVMLLEHCTSSLLPYLDQLIQFMVLFNESENTKIPLEACEFWHKFATLEQYSHLLIPYLPQVLPVFLKSLIYTEDDLKVLGRGDDEENALKPRFLSRSSRLRRMQGGYRQSESSDEDNDDLEDCEFFTEWTLRKFSATSLDALSSSFHSTVTDVLLSLLKDMLYSDDWRIVESGILALGAAAEGGIDDQHLGRYIPYLVEKLSNDNAHVRYISCWTLSRFSEWIVGQCASEKGRTNFYEPVLRQILKRILDKSRRVQEAACSAFSTLEEASTKGQLVPYLPVILNHLTRALRLYKTRNLRLLYDTIGTLAESVGPSLNDPACIAVLMPPLISKWKGIGNNDSDLFPLLGCLTDIATSLGIGFLPFTEPVFHRCVLLVSSILRNTFPEEVDEDDCDDLEDESIIVPLDLLSGIVQGLGSRVEPFVQRSRLMSLLSGCVHCNCRYDVLQPTFALIGYLANACFTTLEPYLDNIMPEIIRQLKNEDPAYKSVRNNAIWALGEISVRWSKEKLAPYVNPILKLLVPLIHPHSQSLELQENAVNTIGRLGIHVAEIAAHFLPKFSRMWLHRARFVKENEEKDTAFQGFCKMTRLYPHALNEVAIRMFLDTIEQWNSPSKELRSLFDQITEGYRTLLTPEQWNQVSHYHPISPNSIDKSATVQ